VNAFKNDEYFKHIKDWSTTTPSTIATSNYIQQCMLDRTMVPRDHINLFLNNSLYANNSFTMLDTLLHNLQPSHAKTLLEAVEQLSQLSMTTSKDATSYMQRVRSLAECLDAVDISQLMPLLANANLDKDRYPVLMCVVYLDIKLTN